MKFYSRKNKGRLIISWFITLCLLPLISLILAIAVLISTDAGKSSLNQLLNDLSKKDTEANFTELDFTTQKRVKKQKHILKFRLHSRIPKQTKRKPRKKLALA